LLARRIKVGEGAERIEKLPKLVSDKSYALIFERQNDAGDQSFSDAMMRGVRRWPGKLPRP